VKHWQETARVVERAVRLGCEGQATALAVVTQIHGSAYRRPGAKLLIEPDGHMLGSVSGGCLEEDVRQVGLKVLRSGQSRTLHYDTGDADSRPWGLGLGCDGQVDLLVRPILPAALSFWERVQHLLEGDSLFALGMVASGEGQGGILAIGEEGFLALDGDSTPLGGEFAAATRDALNAGRTGLRALGSRRIFADVLSPPPKLIVCGAGDDAIPVVALATSIGFRVYVADHRSAYLTAERFPAAHCLALLRPDEDSTPLPSDAQTHAVVMTHSLANDTSWVRRLIATQAVYIGVLGPRARTRRIFADLGVAEDARVFGPVGLDLGAEGPEQVAVSIVAELLASRARREPTHLREREMAVHAE
jgi:xanthine dehydrogenase accessory factor